MPGSAGPVGGVPGRVADGQICDAECDHVPLAVVLDGNAPQVHQGVWCECVNTCVCACMFVVLCVRGA